jgi:hypothetical protein
MMLPEAESMINPATDQPSNGGVIYNDVDYHSRYRGEKICHNKTDNRFGNCDVIYSRDCHTVNSERKIPLLAPNTTALSEYNSAMLPGPDAILQYETDVTVLTGSDVTIVTETDDTVQPEFDETMVTELSNYLDSKSHKQNSIDLNESILNEVSQTDFKDTCINYDKKCKERIESMRKSEEKDDIPILTNNDNSPAYAKITSTCSYVQPDQPQGYVTCAEGLQDYVTCAEVMNC